MEITTLQNGLVVITKSDSNAKTVTISYAIKVGSYDEDKDTMGIAHFTEHMLFKGTTSRSPKEISEAIEGIGGILNAATSFESTQYYCTVPAEKWKTGIEIISDLVWNNLIPEEEFDRERAVILEELKMYNDDPAFRCAENLFILMHQNNINRQYIGGTLDTVKNITRRQMIEFIDKFYIPSNIFIVAAGNINHAELCGFINNYCSTIDFKNNGIDFESTFNEETLDGKVMTDTMDINQSHLCWGLFAPPANMSEFAVAEVTCCLLGGNSSSRLYQIIREQLGLAYTVSMDLEALEDATILNGYVGLDGNNIESVKQIIINEFDRLKSEAVDDRELERAKAYIRGKNLICFERTSSVANHIIANIILGTELDIEKYLEKINSVTPKQIQNFVKKYFVKENICFSEVVPKNKN